MTTDERKAWLAGLKVGDEVVVCDGWQPNEPMFTRRVMSITKSGRVRVNRHPNTNEGTPVEYNADGTVRGERSHGYHRGPFEHTEIFPATTERKDELRKILDAKKLDAWRTKTRHHLIHGVSRDDVEALTDDQLRAIEAILWPPNPEDADA